MTDSLDEQLRDMRRNPTPDEAYRHTFNVGTDDERARLRSEVKLPNLLGRPSASPHASAIALAAIRPYSEGRRFFYGLLWSGWTLLLAIAGFGLLPHGSTFFSGLLAFALAIITGQYAYRIWTWQAKGSSSSSCGSRAGNRDVGPSCTDLFPLPAQNHDLPARARLLRAHIPRIGHGSASTRLAAACRSPVRSVRR
jgi:hypothetical protein